MHRKQRLPQLIRFFAAIVALLGLLAAGCGIPTENSVRPIQVDGMPERLKPIPETTTPTSLPVPGYEIEIFFYRQVGEVIDLVAVTRQAESATPEAALRALLTATPTEEEEADDLKSFLGGAATEDPIELIGIDVIDDRRLVIDLTDVPAIQGELAAIPWAQIVFTVTQDFGNGLDFQRARFERQGERVPSLSENETIGKGTAISRNEFLSFDPEERPEITVPPTTSDPES